MVAAHGLTVKTMATSEVTEIQVLPPAMAMQEMMVPPDGLIRDRLYNCARGAADNLFVYVFALFTKPKQSKNIDKWR